MSKNRETKTSFKGDFGHVRTHIRRNQIVGFFDLVAYTDHKSNDDLLAAVKAMETQIGIVITREDYAWDDRLRGGRSLEAPQNEILLRPTGDGYFIGFSQADKDLEVLNALVDIHKGICKGHQVNLGINKGTNFVTMDITGRVNVIGWGINYAARALQFAQGGQIICTSYFADPLMKEHGDKVTEDIMVNLGRHKIKNTELELFNYYRPDEFGAPPAKDQIK